MLGPHTEQFLATGNWDFPGVATKPCQGAKYHSPTPLFTTQVALVPLAWSEDAHKASATVWLCGTCRDNLDILQQMLYAAEGRLDWHIRREFGNDLRALAVKGWRTFVETLDLPDPVEQTRRSEEA